MPEQDYHSDEIYLVFSIFYIITSEPHLFTAQFFKKIYLFLPALGLRCCTRAFSSCGERGLLFVAVHGLLTVVASLAAEHGL